MPTYEYKCEGCGHNFDEFQWMKEDPLKVCPKCGEEKLRRLFGSGSAVIFKGSGFYETDYRSDSYKSGAKADQEASKSSTSGTSTSGGSTSTNGTSNSTPSAGKTDSPKTAT
jgi:putative FmdB family regulatory protein